MDQFNLEIISPEKSFLIKNDTEEKIRIDSRPSDAIAVAVRTSVPIFVSEAVMLKAKMVNSEKDEEETRVFIYG